MKQVIIDRFKKSPSFRLKRSEMEKSLNYVKRFLHCGRNDDTCISVINTPMYLKNSKLYH